MTTYHKHKGVQYADGKLKSHPVEQNHKLDAKLFHNKALTGAQKKYIQQDNPKLVKALIKNSVDVTNTKKVLSGTFGTQVKEKPLTGLIGSRPQTKTPTGRNVLVPIDGDGYVSLDLDTIDAKGLKVTFSRLEGRTKKQVGLIIDNKPTNVVQKNLKESYLNDSETETSNNEDEFDKEDPEEDED